MPGTLTLRPLSAKLTRNTELFGTMDPYCKVVMGKQKVQSEVCTNGGKNPHWEGSFLVLKRNNEAMCEVEIKEKDWLLPDGTIGTCKINLQEVENQKRTLKWYPVLFKDKPAGQILIEASYEPDNVTSKNSAVTEAHGGPQQVQSTSYSAQPMPIASPVQHDFRQPTHNQGEQILTGHVHGFNPLNQIPQNVPQTGYNQPVNTLPNPQNDMMFAPPVSSLQQNDNYPQKYPHIEPAGYQYQYNNQNYEQERNAAPYSNQDENRNPYNYDSRPVTDFPYTDASAQREQKPFDPLDLIRGSR